MYQECIKLKNNINKINTLIILLVFSSKLLLKARYIQPSFFILSSFIYLVYINFKPRFLQ